MTKPARPPDSAEVLARVAQAMKLLGPIARQVQARIASKLPLDDLMSFGSEGALAAARTYDATRGVPFERWASLKIRGAVLEGLRREGDLPRRLHARLRAIAAANDAEEGLLEEDASAPCGTPEGADARITDYLTAMATSMALGSLTLRDDALIAGIADDRGTAEDEVLEEERKAQVRAAIEAQPARERELLQRYYFEGKTLEEASGGLSRSWSSRLLAQATLGVARALKRADRIDSSIAPQPPDVALR